MIDREIFQKLAELKRQSIDAALATIVETSGSTPREVGAKMIICADGTIYGSVGGGCGEAPGGTAVAVEGIAHEPGVRPAVIVSRFAARELLVFPTHRRSSMKRSSSPVDATDRRPAVSHPSQPPDRRLP